MRKSVAIGLGLLLIGGTVWAQQYLIATVAGGGLPPTPAPAASTAIEYPLSVAADSVGNVYFIANNSVFKVDASGVLTRVAGSSTEMGYSGDDGLATSAQLANPQGLAVDGSGNLYFADLGNNVIRKVAAATGIITTVAGNGSPGYSGDGGPSTSAQLSYPSGVAVDGSGNLYIADQGNSRVRKVTAATGAITTAAGNGTFGYSGDGGPAIGAQLSDPRGVAVDGSGNLYIADLWNHVIRKVAAATGIITTVAGNGAAGYSGDQGPATSAQLTQPYGVAVDGSGNLYIADFGYGVIRKVAVATGIITTGAGGGAGDPSGGGPAVWAHLYGPSGVAVDGSGNFYIADYNVILKVTAAGGIISMVAGGCCYGYSGDGGPATSAQLAQPPGVAVDGSGNIYIANWDNPRIRKVAAATGIVTTVAGNGTLGYSGDGGPATDAQLSFLGGVAVDGSGNLYIADGAVIRKVAAATGAITRVAGNGGGGYSGDGGPATSAQFLWPQGMAVDGAGNLYIADSGNNAIRKVAAATAIITTVAGNGTAGYSGDGGPAIGAQLGGPQGVAVDGSGNIYIADHANNRIRKVAAATGAITTVAGNGAAGYSGDGGLATSARLNHPTGVAVDSSGNLYISEGVNNCIRKVAAAAGIITTVAGNGTAGYSGDGGPSTSAQLASPQGVAVGPAGDLYIADSGNSAIRLVAPGGTNALLSLTKTHSANFAQGQTGAPYSVVVSNVTGAGPTSGMVTATEIVPAGLTLVSMSGAGWNCSGATCTRYDALNPGASYPPITLTVNVAEDPPVQMLNQVTLSGGGARAAGASDLTTISGVVLVNSGGVVSAASYTAPVAPGSIAALFGNFLFASPIPATSFPIPTSLGGLSLQFGGPVLAPLFYASFGQVNAQVPWELDGQSQTTITASINGQTSAPQTVSLTTYAPGIFTANGQGTGPGAILDSNYHLVSATNPTTAGAIIQLYCTGLGPVTNQPATGAPSPLDPLARTTTLPVVTIGGARATVQFSGLTPGDVGLYQVNAYVPAASSKGAAVPVTIAIGGATSNTVTIAVQ
jgi:uncharacterized protein (TIGR03437 family)